MVRSKDRLLDALDHADQLQRPAKGCLLLPGSLAPAAQRFETMPVLHVANPLEALRSLAVQARSRMSGALIAITGTVAKTTTRRMLTHILENYGSVTTNRGDLNSGGNIFEQMASTRRSTDFAVFELGLGAGKDAFLRASSIMRPHVVLVTQVDIAHLDSLTDDCLDEDSAIRLIAEQKLQLADSLHPGGTIVLNGRIPIVANLVTRIRERRLDVLCYGGTYGAAQIVGLKEDEGATLVEAVILGEEVRYRLGVRGKNALENSLGALLVAAKLGVDARTAARSLETFEAVPGRGTVMDLQIRGNRVTLVDDSFNATPLSVRSSLKFISEIVRERRGRKIAVLGDIAHLGKASASIHAALAMSVVESGVDKVYTMGDEMMHLQRALPDDLRGGHFESHAELVDALVESARDGDVLTVKASMPLRFGKVVQMLHNRSEER